MPDLMVLDDSLKQPGGEGWVAVPVDDEWLITWAKTRNGYQINLPRPGSDDDASVQLSRDHIAKLAKLAGLDMMCQECGEQPAEFRWCEACWDARQDREGGEYCDAMKDACDELQLQIDTLQARLDQAEAANVVLFHHMPAHLLVGDLRAAIEQRAAEIERMRTALNAVYNSVSLECPMPGPVFAKVMDALGLAKQ